VKSDIGDRVLLAIGKTGVKLWYLPGVRKFFYFLAGAFLGFLE
jgi:hypothetical protein